MIVQNNRCWPSGQRAGLLHMKFSGQKLSSLDPSKLRSGERPFLHNLRHQQSQNKPVQRKSPNRVAGSSEWTAAANRNFLETLLWSFCRSVLNEEAETAELEFQLVGPISGAVACLDYEIIAYNSVTCYLLKAKSKTTIAHNCHEDERASLLSFKSLLDDPSARLSSWQGLNCCNWHGILCSDSSHVTSIDLRNPQPDIPVRGFNSRLTTLSNTKSMAINGTISPSLFTLRHLRYLDLSFNNFHLSKIPPHLTNLESLTYLNLSNSMLSGSITGQLANLSFLQSLDLSCSVRILDLSSLAYNLSSFDISMKKQNSYIHGGSISSSNLNWLRGLTNLRELQLNGVDLSAASLDRNWQNLYHLSTI
ncbi:receptor-like protein 12 [Cinnamomum micranthum f. kanehirae]|uniref:Receptor-like protein 12 n=1 Tax=Cinnamomum micranthum f. kanehirae TaxID=337451 RepID=A0A3S3PZE1_9MAGN|nr:receptor-like protein 12 [Cinnamomum micranthum f. kanehirae]